MDTVVDASVDFAKDFGSVLGEMFHSIKLRNADDFGFLSRNLIMAGAGFVFAGIVLSLIGLAGQIGMLKFFGFSHNLVFCGALSLCSGIIPQYTAISRRWKTRLQRILNLQRWWT